MAELRLIRFISGLIVLALTAWLAARVWQVILPFALAALFAYLVNPAVRSCESRGLRRDRVVLVAGALALALIVAAAAVGTPVLLEELSQLKHAVPEYRARLEPYLSGRRIPALIKPIERLDPTGMLRGHAASWISHALAQAPDFLFNLVTMLFWAALIPVIGFFFLMLGRKPFDRILNACPDRHVERVMGLICQLDELLGSYLRGILIESAAVGLLSAVGLLILNVDHSLLFGGLAAVGNLVPYAGPVIAGVPATLLVFGKTRSLWAAGKVVLMFCGVRFVDDWFIQPLVMERAVRLHPLVILFAVLCGADAGGILGAFVAVPAAGALKVCWRIFSEWLLDTPPRPFGRPIPVGPRSTWNV